MRTRITAAGAWRSCCWPPRHRGPRGRLHDRLRATRRSSRGLWMARPDGPPPESTWTRTCSPTRRRPRASGSASRACGSPTATPAAAWSAPSRPACRTRPVRPRPRAPGCPAGRASRGGRRTFRFAAFEATEQPGLAVDAAPDRGDGQRMSLARITDAPQGLAVTVFDVTDNGPGNAVGFPDTVVATGLDRTVAHTLGFAVDYVDGPANDVVRVYVDGALVHTAGSWEQYFRNDPEQGVEQQRGADHRRAPGGRAWQLGPGRPEQGAVRGRRAGPVQHARATAGPRPHPACPAGSARRRMSPRVARDRTASPAVRVRTGSPAAAATTA